MGRFNEWLGLRGRQGPGRSCPDCGSALDTIFDDEDGSRFECPNEGCPGSRIYFGEGNGLVAMDLRRPERTLTCISCQRTVDGPNVVGPYEDGSNRFGYFRCPWCGTENIMPELDGNEQ